ASPVRLASPIPESTALLMTSFMAQAPFLCWVCFETLQQNHSAARLIGAEISDTEHAPEAPDGIVGLRPGAADEHSAIAELAGESRAQLSHGDGGREPVRGLGIELAELLKLAVLGMVEQFDTDHSRHIDGGGFGGMVF